MELLVGAGGQVGPGGRAPGCEVVEQRRGVDEVAFFEQPELGRLKVRTGEWDHRPEGGRLRLHPPVR